MIKTAELPSPPPTEPTKGLNLQIFRKKHLMLLASILVLFVFLTPYILSLGHLPAPFCFMEAKYSVNFDYKELKLSIPTLTFVLTTENIVNSSYIEVTESVGTDTAKFYVNISDRSIFLSKELLPELPPHGEYYDLWIGEGHKAGDAVKILNSTATLSNSGIKFHGWLFFNSLTTTKIPFSFSRTIEYQGTSIPVDYVGEIGITYDQETGLMIEDHQSWTANLTYPGLPQTLSYEVAITYESSNVRFTYITYLLTIGIYTAIFVIIAFLLFVVIYIWRRGREKELPAPPPETPDTPEAPIETPAEKPETPTTCARIHASTWTTTLISTLNHPKQRSVKIMAEKAKGIVSTIVHVLVASIVTIILGLVFFMIFLWIVSTGSSLVGLGEPNADGAIIAAAILSFATTVSAAISGR